MTLERKYEMIPHSDSASEGAYRDFAFSTKQHRATLDPAEFLLTP